MENVNKLSSHILASLIFFFSVLLWQKNIRAMLGLGSPELTAEDEEWQTLINETTYSKTEDIKGKSR